MSGVQKLTAKVHQASWIVIGTTPHHNQPTEGFKDPHYNQTPQTTVLRYLSLFHEKHPKNIAIAKLHAENEE